MDLSRVAATIWQWGVQTKDEMEQAAKDIADIGYRSFETVKASIYAYDFNLDDYKEVLERYNIKPVSFYLNLPRYGEEAETFDSLDRELAFIAALEVDRISLQATHTHPGKLDEKQLDFELRLIEKFARKTKEYGITTNLHNHHNTWVMYEHEIDNILRNLDADIISFCPDTAHLVAGLCDPAKVIEKYADRVNFTHFKDIMNAEVISEGMGAAGVEVYANFCEMGKGGVDFHKIFDILKAAGYDGPLCEELDVAPINNKESAKNNFHFILDNY